MSYKKKHNGLENSATRRLSVNHAGRNPGSLERSTEPLTWSGDWRAIFADPQGAVPLQRELYGALESVVRD